MNSFGQQSRVGGADSQDRNSLGHADSETSARSQPLEEDENQTQRASSSRAHKKISRSSKQPATRASHTSSLSISSLFRKQRKEEEDSTFKPQPGTLDLPLDPRVPYPNLFPSLPGPSTNAVPDSVWSSQSFLLGAGLVIIQPSSGKVVVVYEKEKHYWFLPRGRKDVGESLEQAALREGYEESGYRAQFFPLDIPSLQPTAPGALRTRQNTEPIHISMRHYPRHQGREQSGYEYLTFWYIGYIEADAVREEGTGMPDEQHFESHLLTFEEAERRLSGWAQEVMVLRYARDIFRATLERETQARAPMV